MSKLIYNIDMKKKITGGSSYVLKGGQSHYQKNKQYYIDKAKKHMNHNLQLIRKAKEIPCMDCKKKYPYYVMDFDHRPDEDKKFELAGAHAKHGKNVILAEIAKCDVVCSNCHRKRTHIRLSPNG